MSFHQAACFIRLFLLWLKVYFLGFIALIRQIFQKHKAQQDIPLQTGKVAIVTGGATGIGFYVSLGLVAKNVHVVIGCKCDVEGQAAIDRIREDFPNAKVDYIPLNLCSLKSVHQFAEIFLSRNLPLHILINNAGVMFHSYSLTEDGYDIQMQVNYISHFYLTQLLLGKLKESGADNSWSRIVNVSSIVHYSGWLDPSNLARRFNTWYEYSPHAVYCDSKLAVIAGSYELDNRLRGSHSKVTVNALHPGIVQSNLIRHIHWAIKWMLNIVAFFTYKSTEQGADTILYVALSPELEGQSGCYYDNCTATESSSQSYSRDLQQHLWTYTCELVDQASTKLE